MATYFLKEEVEIYRQAGARLYRSADTNVCVCFALVHALSVDERKHKCATLLYTTCRTLDGRGSDAVVVCWLP